MTTKKKNILIAVLATVLLSAFIFVMFFLDDTAQPNDKTLSYVDKQRLVWDAQKKWYKECAEKYDFLTF